MKLESESGRKNNIRKPAGLVHAGGLPHALHLPAALPFSRLALFLGLSILPTMCATAHGQRVVLVHRDESLSSEATQIEELVAWSGLELQSIEAGAFAKSKRSGESADHDKVLAVFMEAGALSIVDPPQSGGWTRDGAAIPTMVFGIDARTDPKLLRLWSGGAVDRCVPSSSDASPGVLHISTASSLSGILAGIDLPAVDASACRLQFSKERATVVLGSAPSAAQARSQDATPELIETNEQHTEIYFVPRRELFDRSWLGQPGALSKAFSSIAPFLLFLHSKAGDYRWHLEGHYANFTIDDPWLTEPYGNLDYSGLLDEMRRSHFHTTIAFVPWNYDRNDRRVTELFRTNPEYYSVSLHGNNHLHREFGDYSEHPLNEQTADIRQAIGRMQSFSRITGVPYDRFMVFPHGVSPEATFAALKSYGFLGTANSLSVPLDAQVPADPLFQLKPFTTQYGNLLSFARYSVEAPLPQRDLRIQSFLGNPVLLYAHQSFFANGIAAFSPIAESLNSMQPDIRWVGLGELARHTYETRLRQDGKLDVRMLSSEMELTNSSNSDRTYFVTIVGRNAKDAVSVTIDGHAQSLHSDGMSGAVVITIPSHQSRALRTGDADWLNLAGQSAHKGGAREHALRYVSDFRDMRLSRLGWGRGLIDAYYNHDGERLEHHLEIRWFYILVAMITAVGVVVYLLQVRRQRILKQTGSMRTTAR